MRHKLQKTITFESLYTQMLSQSATKSVSSYIFWGKNQNRSFNRTVRLVVPQGYVEIVQYA